MTLWSQATALVHMTLLAAAVGSGLLAALLSQVTSSDYHAVVRATVVLTAVSAAATAGFAASVRGPVWKVLLMFTVLGAAGAAEVTLRVSLCGCR